MDLSRLRRPEITAAAGGVALLVVMFLRWYSVAGVAGVRGESAWEAFSVLDVFLALLALLAISIAVLAATRDSPALPTAAATITAALGIVATLLVLYRILNQPGPNEFVQVRWGAFLGFVSVLAIAAGGWSSMSVDDTPDPARIPARPAPPPGAADEPA